MCSQNENYDDLRTFFYVAKGSFFLIFFFKFGRIIDNLHLLPFLFAIQLERFDFEIYEFEMGMRLPFALKQFAPQLSVTDSAKWYS